VGGSRNKFNLYKAGQTREEKDDADGFMAGWIF
jgi:hypothetical protein